MNAIKLRRRIERDKADRTAIVQFRLTPSERELFEGAALDEKTSISTFARRAMLDRVLSQMLARARSKQARRAALARWKRKAS